MFTLIRLVSSFFCIAIIAFFVSGYFGAKTAMESSSDYVNGDTVIMYVSENPEERPLNESDISNYEIWAWQDRIVFEKAYLTGVDLIISDNNISNLYNNFVAYGTTINNSETECVIGKKVSDKYKINIGDSITVGNVEFVVVGVTDIPRLISKIIICREDVANIGYPQFYYNTFGEPIKGNGNTYSGSEISAYWGRMLDDWGIIVSIIVVCVIILLYTILSIVNILIFYKNKSLTALEVQHFVGGSFMIFWQRMIENIIILTASVILAYFSMLSLLETITKYTALYCELPGFSLLYLEFFAIILSIIYSVICGKRKADCK